MRRDNRYEGKDFATCKPELLAPAGNPEKLVTAIHYGADAVYIGDPRFSLRSKTDGFDDHLLMEAISYAHGRGVRVFVTVNIFPHNRDLVHIADHISFLKQAKPDAVILSDPGLFSLFRKEAPDIDIHISTQANITNHAAARFWEDLGAKRLILSRELSLEEIREIRNRVSIELEVFVHGSICLSYSGRCYISSFLASRSANRGECTNSCRWNYALMEEKRQGEFMPVFENERGTYLLSSKDLCMVQHLRVLAEAGIDSFKIEGRMKGINYVAGVVKTYREAIDSMEEDRTDADKWLRELSMFSGRGFTTGMFFGKQDDGDYNFDGESYRSSHELVGVVLENSKNVAKVALRNRLDIGDELMYLTPGIEEFVFPVEHMKNCDFMDIETARNEDVIYMPVPARVRPNDIIRRKTGIQNSRRISAAVNNEC